MSNSNPVSDESAIVPSRRPLLSWMASLLHFKFMTHDRWANALFLHWKVPPHLESVLQGCTAPFLLDRYFEDNDGDGSVYIGLILLTEQNVGPSIGRTSWTTVTHHGVNVRTYIRHDKTQQQQQYFPPGIHFSSLECDDELTSFGANQFGMPYKMACIERTFVVADDTDKGEPVVASSTSSAGVDHRTCSKYNDKIQKFRLKSQRLEAGQPSLWRILSSFIGSMFQKAESLHASKFASAIKSTEDCIITTATQPTFSVDCSWSVVTGKPESETTYDNHKFAHWVVERYYVCTQKYGLLWNGRVEHEPWPLRRVELDRLILSGVDAYEPSQMRPVLEHMANHRPDSVLFSPGVGPVQFNMLRPL